MTAPVIDKVNFKAYCKAFEALGFDSAKKDTYANEICENLHAKWRSAGNDVYIHTDLGTPIEILSRALDFFSGLVGVGGSVDPGLKLIKTIFEKILQ